MVHIRSIPHDHHHIDYDIEFYKFGHMQIRNNIKYSQRFEYGIYQFLDHFLTRKIAFALTGSLRRNLYKRIAKTIKSGGKGKILEIDRRENLSIEELQNEYIKKGIPVVIEGGAKNWPCMKKWSLDYFKALHGEDEILLVDSKHIEQDYEKTTLGNLIDDIKAGGKKYYRFYPLLSEHPEHLADFDYKWLKKVRHKKVMFEAFQVFIGGKDTESPLHNAMQCNLFVQVHGEKRWSIIRPEHTAIIDPDPIRNIYRGGPFRRNNYAFNPFKPDYEKPYELFEYIDRYDFVLKPGDILWNPPFWWHSVINQSDSIGVGYRWISSSYAFGKTPLYTFLDFFATKPFIWKGLKLSKKDLNLVHLAEDGRLEEFLKEKNVNT